MSEGEERTFNLKPACLSLRHKLMYVDSRQSTPGLVDDESDTRVYFCIKSQDTLGPDNEPVCTKSCTAERACFHR